jgi:hypothetical protein
VPRRSDDGKEKHVPEDFPEVKTNRVILAEKLPAQNTKKGDLLPLTNSGEDLPKNCAG